MVVRICGSNYPLSIELARNTRSRLLKWGAMAPISDAYELKITNTESKFDVLHHLIKMGVG